MGKRDRDVDMQKQTLRERNGDVEADKKKVE
jgi:hypothetical protein